MMHVVALHADLLASRNRVCATLEQVPNPGIRLFNGAGQLGYIVS